MIFSLQSMAFAGTRLGVLNGLALLCVWMGTALFGFQVRPAEPVLVDGDELPHLNGVPLTDLQLLALVGDAWVAVPFQIDERGPDGSFFTADDGLWDADDQLVFQPQFGGETASNLQWVDHPDTWGHPRTCITVNDPVTLAQSVVYLYQSSTAIVMGTGPLVSYDMGQDRIEAQAYEAGFDDVLLLWDELVLLEDGVPTADLLDREKFRIEGRLPPLNLPFTLDEEDPVPQMLDVASGDVRVMRRVSGEINVVITTLPFTLERHYYAQFIGIPTDGTISIPADSGVEAVRFSTDYSPAAAGAAVSDPNNAQLIVDGNPDGNVVTQIAPGQQAGYWLGFEFGNLAVFNVGNFSGLADQALLYFHDDMTGGTADGTADTGDLVSFGDTGIRLIDPIPGDAELGVPHLF